MAYSCIHCFLLTFDLHTGFGFLGLSGFAWLWRDPAWLQAFSYIWFCFICLYYETQDEEVVAVQGMLSSVDDRTTKERNLSCGGPFIASTQSYLLTFSQPHQVTGSRPESRGKGRVFHLQWNALQSYKAKDADVLSYYQKEKMWE